MNKKRIIIILSSLVLLLIVYLFSSYFFSKTEVLLYELTREDMEEFVEERGEVYLDDQQIIYSSMTGFISEINFEPGQSLIKGDNLFKIDSLERESLVLQRDSVSGQIESLERKLLSEREMLEKNLLLKEAGALSQMDYDDFYNILKDTENKLENLQRELKYINQNITDKNQRILSPINGILLNTYVSKGDYILPGNPLAMLGNMDKIMIESDLLTIDLQKVKEGDQVLISSDIEKNKKGLGQVSKIYPLAFSKTSDLGVEQKRVKVEVSFLEGLEELRPGYQVDLKIITSKKENVLQIPDNALFKIDGEDYLFLVKNGRANLQKVSTGLKVDRKVEILDGLKEGDLLILSPQADLKDGKRVKVK